MHEDIQYRHNTELLNAYIERDIAERAARESLLQAIHRWNAGEGSTQDPVRDSLMQAVLRWDGGEGGSAACAGEGSNQDPGHGDSEGVVMGDENASALVN